MTRKCHERLAGVRSKDKEVAARMMSDIKTVAHHSMDEETFQLALSLMFKKYQEESYPIVGTKKEVLAFLNYFRDEWTKKRDQFRWWQGSNPGHVKTNNALERNNRTVKEQFARGEKLGLQDLLNKV